MAWSSRLVEYCIPLVILLFVFGLPGLDSIQAWLAFAPAARSRGEQTTKHASLFNASNFINHRPSFSTCASPDTRIFIYSRQPLVVYLESFLASSEAEQLIDLTAADLKPSLLGSGNSTFTSNQSVRNSTTAAVPTDHELSLCIANRALSFQGWPKGVWLEKLMTQRYTAPHGHYSHHFDWASVGGKQGRRQSGGRQSSFMVWLNNPAKGGGTNFPRLPRLEDAEWCRFIECGDSNENDGTTFKPLKGNAVFWENFEWESGELVEQTWHAGLPVEEGEKWGLNVWSWWLPGFPGHESST